jgi:GNAT superfamily N-acetyltransferase
MAADEPIKVIVRPLRRDDDLRMIVSIWQQGFLELAPHIHRFLKASWVAWVFFGTCFALGVAFKSQWGIIAALAATATFYSPVGGWLLRNLLWRGILAETQRDMTESALFERYQKSGFSQFLVAEVKGVVMGCVAIIKEHTLYKERRPTAIASETEASIWRLSVAPHARKLGVGRLLMAAAEEWARNNRCSHVTLVTGNKDSVIFYQRLGYGPETEARAVREVFGAAGAKGLAAKFKLRTLRSRLTDRGTILMKALPDSNSDALMSS